MSDETTVNDTEPETETETATETETEQEEEQVQLRGVKSSNEGPPIKPPMELHGRRQIFTNEAVITAENVVPELNKWLSVHNRNRAEINYLERYVRGEQPILDRIKKYRAEINNRVVVNIANQITAFKTAEFAGEPIQYVSSGKSEDVPQKIEALNGMMLSEGKMSRDMKLAYDLFTCGVGYRLVLMDKAEGVGKKEILDEAPFEIYIPDPKNTFVVRLNDVTRRVVAGVSYVYLDESRNRVLYTVYTPNSSFQIEGTGSSVKGTVKETVYNFGIVPLVEYPCNNVYMGAFEPVLPLLDAYNNITSNRMDAIEQFVQAIMVFEGVDITNEMLDQVKERGALKIPPTMDGRTGKVYYLNEQLDQTQTQALVDDLYNTILSIVGMPSHGSGNTSDSSNNGAVMLKNGWWDAEARNLEVIGSWRQSETDFLKIVLLICQRANVLSDLKLSDIIVKFGSHSYEDKLVKTQSFTTLIGAGVPPIQAYTVSGMLTDPEAASIAFEKYRKEREAEELEEEADTRRNNTADAPNLSIDTEDTDGE